MKRHSKTQITVWPAITDLMTAVTIIAILGSIVGHNLSSGREPDDITERERILLELDAARTSILNEFKKELSKYDLNVEIIDDEGVLRLHDDAINFGFSEEAPLPEHQINVGILAQVLADIVPCYSNQIIINGKKSYSRPNYCNSSTKFKCGKNKYKWLIGTILIEGHTDSVPVGRKHRLNNNLELSSVRSASVYKMITDCEPSINKMRNSKESPIFSTSGYGDMRPAIEGNSHDKKNRRIDIRLLLEPRPDKD